MSGTMIGTPHIFFQKSTKWLLVLVTAILVSTFTSALSFTAPSEVIQGETFSVTIQHDDQATADIKLFVQSQALQNLSKIIIDGQEKSTFYYLKEVFPHQTAFTLIVVQFGPSAELCIRLRKTGKTAYEEVCQLLSIIERQGETERESPSPEKKSLTQEKPAKQTASSTSSAPSQQTLSSSQNSSLQQAPALEPIRLTSSLPLPSEDSSVLWKIGLFTLLSLTILILLILGKI